jgi:4-methyl-5(b-hydroxyethyl)-thiazole monophosphate biosynthesis
MAGMKVAVLLAPGFEEIEAMTPIDFLRRAGIQVVVTGVGECLIEGSHGIKVQADVTIDELREDFDGVVVPGGMPGSANLAASDDVSAFIRNLHTKGKLIASICAAPAVVLGPLGILEGRKATGHPTTMDELNRYAETSEERVVKDGSVITSRGAGTAAEFSLAVIAYLAGEQAAAQVQTATLQK